MRKIKLLRNKTISLIRRSKGDELTVGDDIQAGVAETLIRTKNAEWVKDTPKKKAKKEG